MQIVSQIFIPATHEIPLRVAEGVAIQAICTEETTNKWIYYPLSHKKGHSIAEYPLFHIQFDFLWGGTSPAASCPDALRTHTTIPSSPRHAHILSRSGPDGLTR